MPSDVPPDLEHHGRPDPDLQPGLVLDLALLEELRQLEGPDASCSFAALVELFHKEFALRSAEMREGLDRRDARAVTRAAHALKGSACGLGAMDLALACQRLEIRSKEGRLEDLEALLNAVIHSHRLAAEALNVWKNKGG